MSSIRLTPIYNFNFNQDTYTNIYSLFTLNDPKIIFLLTRHNLYHIVVGESFLSGRTKVNEIKGFVDDCHNCKYSYLCAEKQEDGTVVVFFSACGDNISPPSPNEEEENNGRKIQNQFMIFLRLGVKKNEEGVVEEVEILSTKKLVKGQTIFITALTLGNGERYFMHFSTKSRISYFKGFGNEDRGVDEQKYFPEGDYIKKSLPIALKFLHFRGMRISACCGLNGILRVVFVDLKENKVVKTFQSVLDSPASSVEFFTIKRRWDVKDDKYLCPHPLVRQVMQGKKLNGQKGGSTSKKSDEDPLLKFHLLVGESVGKVTIYWNVLEKGLRDSCVIMNGVDSVLTTTAVDVSGNGVKEILIGTYSSLLVVYSFATPLERVYWKPVDDDEVVGKMHQKGDKEEKWKRGGDDRILKYEKTDKLAFHTPVYSINPMDVTNDGVEEFVICTMKNLSILQCELKVLEKTIRSKLEKIKTILKCQEEENN